MYGYGGERNRVSPRHPVALVNTLTGDSITVDDDGYTTQNEGVMFPGGKPFVGRQKIERLCSRRHPDGTPKWVMAEEPPLWVKNLKGAQPETMEPPRAPVMTPTLAEKVAASRKEYFEVQAEMREAANAARADAASMSGASFKDAIAAALADIVGKRHVKSIG